MPALDGLRAVAVLAVLAFHLDLVPGGFVGVQLFFVLSGFLIASLLLRERDRTGTVDLRGFYARRAARLMPAAVAMIAVTSLVSAVLRLESRANTLIAAVASVLYVSNILSTARNQFVGILNHTWSLSQEEQFYLTAPWFLRRSVPERRRHRAGVLVAVMVLLVVTRGVLALCFPDAVPALYHHPVLNADALIAGVALALLYAAPEVPAPLRSRTFAIVAGGVGLVGVLVVVAVFALDDLGLAVAEPVAVLGGVGLLVSITSADGCLLVRLLAMQPAQWIGRRSYSMYLVQVPLLFVWRRVLDLRPASGPHLVLVLAVLASTVVLGAVSTRWLETPLRRWARRRFPDRGSEVPTAAAPETTQAPAGAGACAELVGDTGIEPVHRWFRRHWTSVNIGGEFRALDAGFRSDTETVQPDLDGLNWTRPYSPSARGVHEGAQHGEHATVVRKAAALAIRAMAGVVCASRSAQEGSGRETHRPDDLRHEDGC